MSSNDFPKCITQQLTAYHLEALAPAWVELESKTTITKAVGGAWKNYFSIKPNLADDLTDSCELLQGMLPFDEPFELPHMQLVEGKYTDIVAFHSKESDWLLFFDVTKKVVQLQEYQQVANELYLLKDQLNNTLGKFVGHEIASRAVGGKLKLKEDGERKVISTLFVDIRGFTTYNEKVDAQEVMYTLNAYMDCMLSAILDNYGLVDKIMGDGVMAVFGIINSDENNVENAFKAALAIQKNVKALNQERGNKGLEILGVGVGVATGDAVLGILGSHERRAFTAIGRHVNFAARLESNARAGEILLDEATLTALSSTPEHHVITLELKGIGKSHAYSIR